MNMEDGMMSHLGAIVMALITAWSMAVGSDWQKPAALTVILFLAAISWKLT